MTQRNVWLAFLLLCITWGTSFLFIKLALVDLHPATLVPLRLTMGMLVLLAVARWRKLTLPRDWRVWQHLFIMGPCPGGLCQCPTICRGKHHDSVRGGQHPLCGVPAECAGLRGTG
ncbi:MAG: DMT family transporter [Candidatus Promineifilaceae bacterium]